MNSRVRLVAEPDHVVVPPGERQDVGLIVENVGDIPATYRLSITGLPYDWYELSATRFSLAPGASERLQLALEPIDDEMSGHYPFRVLVTADDDASVRASTIIALLVASDSAAAWPAGMKAPAAGAPHRRAPAGVAPPGRSGRLPAWLALPVAAVVLLLALVAARAVGSATALPASPVASASPTALATVMGGAVPRTPRPTASPATPRKTGGGRSQTPRPGEGIHLGATALSFGARTMHAGGVTRTLQISNLGSARVKIRHVTVSGAASADFTLRGACINRSLDVHATCLMTIVFAPRAKGPRSATLSVAGSATASPRSVLLSGRGIAGQPASVAGHSVAVAALPRWVNISPPRVSTDFNKPQNNYGFQTIAIDPSHPKTLYVGTCYQGLWKTANGGKTWFKVNTGVNGATLDTGRLWTVAIDPFHLRTLYVAAGYGFESGVWKSTDGGVDWQQMLPPTSSVVRQTSMDVSVIQADPYRAGHLLVAFHGPWGSGSGKQLDSGVLESLDGGRSWIVHAAHPGWGWGNYVFFLNNSSTWLVTTQGDGFWRTTDSGRTWSKVSSINRADGPEGIYRASTGAWYVGAFGTLLRSANDGVTWQSVAPQQNVTNYTVTGDRRYLYAFAVLPNGNGVSAGAGYFVYSKDSDGSSWSRYNRQTFASGPVSMAYDPVNHIVYSSNALAGVWKLQVTHAPSLP